MTRDAAIDAVRGLCIFSMVIGHLCFGSTVWQIIHPVPWIDGASGFVLLSGLVLGMVSRRRADATGVVRSQSRLARRMVLLYVSQLFLTGLFIVMSLAVPDPAQAQTDAGGATAAQTVWWWATLQVNPDHIDILSMYVALQVLAMVWVLFLSRGWWPLVVVSSAAIYIAALALDWGRFPNRPDGTAFFNTAAWQALFACAFLMGWYWSRLRDPLRGRAALMIACAGGLLVALAGLAMSHSETGMSIFDKANCGLGRIALGFAAFVVLYQVMRLTNAHIPALVAPIALVGSRSLSCFITLSVVDIALKPVIGEHTTGTAAQIAAVLTLLAMYPVARGRRAAGMAFTRRRYGSRSLSREYPSTR